MTGWLFVAGAILTEVCGTVSLRVAARGRRRWYSAVVAGYVLAFGLLTLALREGLALGMVYGVWTASGVALTAIASWLLFDERMNRRMVLGIALIAVGVLLVEVGAGG